MKQRDITVIVVSAIVAGIFSYAISNFLFGGSKAYNLTAPKVEVITSEFKSPDPKYFNSLSINPTRNIVIGDTTNPNAIKSQ